MTVKECSKCHVRKPESEFKKRYNRCKECMNHYERMRWARLSANGLCGRCGKHPQVAGYSKCDECLRRDASRREERIFSGVCATCKTRPALKNRSRCEQCYEQRTTLRQERRERGLCDHCTANQPALIGSTRCETCLFKQKAMMHLGSSTKWEILKAIWDRQGGRCPYSGVALSLVDADLDHVDARANGGKNDPDNLQFLWRPINEMKRNHSEAEFFELVRMVYHYSASGLAQLLKDDESG